MPSPPPDNPSSDPSVFAEPHLRPDTPAADAGPEAPSPEVPAPGSETDRLAHNVWDEPALSPDLAGPPPADAPSYAAWLELGRRRTGPVRNWATLFYTALFAGPWAILGAVVGGTGAGSGAGLLAVIVVGPAVEEIMKVMIPLLVVELRPYLLRSRGQILACAAAGGLAFAAIENVVYLRLYIPDPSPGIAAWRWTVCVALHTGCSCLAGLGVARMWTDVWVRRARPRPALGMPLIIAAAVLHGAYNAFAVALEAVDFQF